MAKKILKTAYVAVYAAAAALLVWYYIFGAPGAVKITGLVALFVGLVIHTAYNLRYKPRPDWNGKK